MPTFSDLVRALEQKGVQVKEMKGISAKTVLLYLYIPVENRLGFPPVNNIRVNSITTGNEGVDVICSFSLADLVDIIEFYG